MGRGGKFEGRKLRPTNSFMDQFGSGQRRVWNLPLGKERDGRFDDGGKERRERPGRVVWGLDWGLGKSESGEGPARTVQRYL